MQEILRKETKEEEKKQKEEEDEREAQDTRRYLVSVDVLVLSVDDVTICEYVHDGVPITRRVLLWRFLT